MVTVERPDEERLSAEKVESWPVWEKEVSEFPWEYDMEEICFILEGRAFITAEDGSVTEIGPGDLVTFSQGMKCHWRITEPIRKHYDFR